MTGVGAGLQSGQQAASLIHHDLAHHDLAHHDLAHRLSPHRVLKTGNRPAPHRQ